MEIKVSEQQGVVLLVLEGNIDINASNFIETVGWALVNKSSDILCDLSGIDLVDYVGVSVIAVAYKNVLNHKGRMKMCCVPEHVSRLFHIVGLDRVFEYHDSLELALESFKHSKDIDEILEKKLRRRFKRINLRQDFEYKQKYAAHGQTFTGKVMNLSAIGLFGTAAHVFPIGEILALRLPILADDKFLDVDARVIWIADQQLQPLESPAMGLEFYKIDSDKQNLIIEFVDKHMASDEFEKNEL